MSLKVLPSGPAPCRDEDNNTSDYILLISVLQPLSWLLVIRPQLSEHARNAWAVLKQANDKAPCGKSGSPHTIFHIDSEGEYSHAI